MKIYNKVTIDISTGQTVYEDSYDYQGEVSLAKGGGGGGGGSGEVDYPVYMKEIQADWLAGGEPDGSGLTTLSVGNDITSLLDVAIGNSPFASASAYDPSTELSSMSTALDNFDACSHGVAYLDARTRLDDAVNTTDAFDSTTPYSDTETAISSYETYLSNMSTTDEVETELSNFNSGMTNINAVNSSAFGIGHQIIAGNLIETKAQIYSDLIDKNQRVGDGKVKKYSVIMNSANQIAQLASQQDVQRGQLEIEVATKLLHYSIEYYRMSIAANVEKTNKDIKLDKNDSLWDLEVFRQGANVLASIGGGTVSKTTDDEVSDGQAALGGALSGAAAGSAISPGWGTAIGAVVGGIGGLLS